MTKFAAEGSAEKGGWQRSGERYCEGRGPGKGWGVGDGERERRAREEAKDKRYERMDREAQGGAREQEGKGVTKRAEAAATLSNDAG